GYLEVHGFVQVSGAPTSANFTTSLPSNFEIDTTRLLTTGVSTLANSSVKINDNTTAVFHGTFRYSSSTTLVGLVLGASATFVNEPAAINESSPMTFANGDQISYY